MQIASPVRFIDTATRFFNILRLIHLSVQFTCTPVVRVTVCSAHASYERQIHAHVVVLRATALCAFEIHVCATVARMHALRACPRCARATVARAPVTCGRSPRTCCHHALVAIMPLLVSCTYTSSARTTHCALAPALSISDTWCRAPFASAHSVTP